MEVEEATVVERKAAVPALGLEVASSILGTLHRHQSHISRPTHESDASTTTRTLEEEAAL